MKQLVLRKDDYEIIQSYLKNGYSRQLFDWKNAEELQVELKKAKLVSSDKFPQDIVGLNSKVIVRDDKTDKLMEVILVTPDKADIKEKKISVMAPIGTALIGFREGQQVKWNVPSGKKTFTIIQVVN